MSETGSVEIGISCKQESRVILDSSKKIVELKSSYEEISEIK
jgi:hypothetical protein